MNFKKTIAKSLVVAMALGMVPVANLQTAKAAAKPTALTLVGESGLVTATSAKYWAIAKQVDKAGKGTVEIGSKNYKVSNVQEYLGAIDVYSVLKGKAGTVVIGTTATPDKDNWDVLEIPAAEKSLKVQYVADKKKVKGLEAGSTTTLGGDFGWLVATKVGANKKTEEVALNDKLEGKLNDGNWLELAKLFGTLDAAGVTGKLKIFAQNGSTLSFRIKSANGSFASNEAKVKITPQAKAPAVKFDVTKETVSIKKGMDWQVVEIGNDAPAPVVANWTAAGANTKSMAIADLKVGGSSGTALANDKNYALFVRSSATDKKIASKYSMVTLKARPKKLKFDGDKIEGEGTVIKDEGATKELGSIKSALIYDLSKGAVLTNASTDDWEYALSKDTPTKWSTLKAPKDAKKPSVAKLKYSATEKANTFGWTGAKLYLRVAGTKQTKEGVATLAGVTVDAAVALTKTAQTLSFTGATLENAVDNTSDLSTLKPKYKIATGTAAKITIAAKVSKVVKDGVAPKIKLKSGSKVSVKADKVAKDGKFNITFDISKSLFKTPESIANAVFNLKFEGLDQDFTLELAKKD